MKLKDICEFTKEILEFLESGFTISESLYYVNSQISAKVRENIEKGLSLASSVENVGFPNFYVELIRVSEETGSLQENLKAMDIYFTKKIEFTKELRRSLIYPYLIFLFSICFLLGFFMFVLPLFSQFISEISGIKDSRIEFLLSVSSLLKENFIFVGAFVFLLLYLPFRNDILEKIFPLSQSMRLSILFYSLSLSIKSGLGAIRSIDICSGLSPFPLDSIREGILSGKSFSEVFEFMPNLKLILEKAEKTGKLGEAFERIAKIYERKFYDRIYFIKTLAEPLAVLITGTVVLTICILFWLPILKSLNF